MHIVEQLDIIERKTNIVTPDANGGACDEREGAFCVLFSALTIN